MMLAKSISLRLWQKPGSAFHAFSRPLFSESGTWEKEFRQETRKELESYWKEKIKDDQKVSSQKAADAKKYYVLSMFPYPSGRLHMGHVRVYTISDVMARYHRLTGKHVLHPMAWDAFGLPAENAAIERGEKPDVWTYSNIDNMKKQLEGLAYSFDWDGEYATCDPDYYKWTQYIFLKMYEAGLVYQKEAAVNWDPMDQTVLADEQIDEEGRSWRSGAKAERRFLKQWYIKTTAYSEALYNGLSDVNAELWKDIINLQQNWIGKCDGVRLELSLKGGDGSDAGSLSVFTKHPEGLYGVSHILVSPNHYLNKEHLHQQQIDTNTTRLSVSAQHPFTENSIPIFVSKDNDFGEFLDAQLGIPSCSQAAEMFADKYRLEFVKVIENRKLVKSGQFSELTPKEAFQKITQHAKKMGCGGDVTSERARDWLISRQRFWGTPIPIVHCKKYGAVPVPLNDLPVKLPNLEDLPPDVLTVGGQRGSPLERAEEWGKVKCAKCDCDGYGQRETDTMDTFVDSSWYFLRYTDPHNTQEPFGRDKAHTLMPVDLYIGGKEHAIMHLYYARFFSHFLYDQGLTPTKEPFVNLLTQGMVMGRSYRLKESGQYLSHDKVDFSGNVPVEKGSGSALVVDWEKMSKSKYNGVDPQTVIDEHGTDFTRLCILSNVAPKSDRHWNEEAFAGVHRWQKRIWTLVHDFHECRNSSASDQSLSPEELDRYRKDLFETRNYFLKEITYHLDKTFLLSVAISRLQGLTNALKKIPSSVTAVSAEYEQALAELVIMLSCFAPLFTSELWAGLQSVSHLCHQFEWDKSVFHQAWPKLDPSYRLSLRVRKNNRDVFELPMPMAIGQEAGFTRDEALALAKTHPDFETTFGTNVVNTLMILQPGFKAELTITSGDDNKKEKKKLQKRRKKIKKS